MEKKKDDMKSFAWSGRCSGVGLPLILLIVGVYWLLKDLGYIQTNISIWPILLIVLGLYWIIGRIFCKCCN